MRISVKSIFKPYSEFLLHGITHFILQLPFNTEILYTFQTFERSKKLTK